MGLRNLIPKPALEARIQTLGQEIQTALSPDPLDVLILLKGAFLFGSDLIRSMERVQSIHFAQPKSYRGDSQVAGELDWKGPKEINRLSPRLLILDEILDTGATLKRAREEMALFGYDSIHTAVLLRKERAEPPVIEADFVGFEIPDYFVVGYGLDLGEKYRNLDGVFIYEESGGS